MPMLRTSPPGAEDILLMSSKMPAENLGPLPATSDVNGATQAPQSLNIPAVHLDVEEISSAMAAQLASSLVSHVLFLKSQIPFPVVQLSRMPSLDSESKSAKKKLELINAIDTLSSHLHTTFRALSTAIAITQSDHPAHQTLKGQAYMSIVVGPSVGVPKARVMLVMSGLEVKHAGASGTKANEPCVPEETPEGEEAEEFDSGSEPEDSDSEGSEFSDDDSVGSEDSPATPSRSTAPSPSESKVTFMEEQQALRTADRLLSRTLASACAEPDGGLAGELAATQTHVLLRAPRHFDHPEWTPRQNLTRSLEKSLHVFLRNATAEPQPSNSKGNRPHTTGPHTEGVWIGCQGETLHVDLAGETTASTNSEDDDMIWWTWNGKIVGFSDW